MPKKRSNFNKLEWHGLSTQVFLFAILPISIILLVVTFGSLALHQNAMRTLVGERDSRTVQSASNAIREQLNHRVAAIYGLALRTEDNANLDSILDSASFLLPDFDVGIAFYSSNGKDILSFSGDQNLWKALEDDSNKAIEDYFRQSRPQPYFSDPVVHPIYDNFLVYILSQARPDLPVVVGAFSITSLANQTLAGASSYGDEVALAIIDQRGNLLYQSGGFSPEGNPLNHPGVTEALHGRNGTTYLSTNGTEHVVAYTSIAPIGWALVIEEPWDSVASPMLRYSEAGPLVLVPILLFALGALYLSARQIIQPLKKLETKAAAMEWGDYQAVKNEVGGINEVRSLQRTLVHLADKVQKAQQGLRGYIGAITEGQEEERKRLARELHDDTLQSLIALNQRIQFVKRLTEDKQVKEALNEIEEMMAETMDELRRLSRALRPLYLEDLGLVPAVKILVQESNNTSGLSVKFFSMGTEFRLNDDEEIATFRIAQEGLSNIIRHADATEATISLIFKEDEVILTITDNGTGFEPLENPGDLAPKGHFGLLGIYERTQMLGAKFNIISNPGSGTHLVIQLPINE